MKRLAIAISVFLILAATAARSETLTDQLSPAATPNSQNKTGSHSLTDPANTYYPSGYNLLGSTSLISGSLSDLQLDDGAYMIFRSYTSATSSQTLYAHGENTTIAGAEYYLLKKESADSPGTSLSMSMGTVGRQLLGKFVYPLAGVTSISGSTWTVYYRTWHSAVPSDVSTNSPSSIPAGTWNNPTNAYTSDNTYATTTTDGATQQYGNYGFSLPAGATITKVEVGYEAYTAGNEKVGVTLSWDGGTTWATEVVSSPLGTTDPNTVAWVDFTTATSWDVDKLSNTNLRSRVKGVKTGAMSTVYLDWIPLKVTYTAPPSAHTDIDILVRQLDGMVRDTIATDVADSANLTTTATTLSGTHSWSSYTVVDQTDYLEIDYYLHVAVANSGVTGYLRIDDNALAIDDQTRVTNVMLPSEYTMEMEFTGSSDTYDWNQLVWTVDSAWNTANVTVTLQLYNYTLSDYPTTGDGYIAYTSSSTPNTDETRNQIITTNPTNFRDSLGNWKIKVKGVKSTTTQFDFKADLVRFEASYTAPDMTPPVWSNTGTNNTVVGKPTLFYVKWTDNVGLSGFIFGTNNTGAWTNDTWTSMNGVSNWSNATKTLNSTEGAVVQWRVWANDTSNNWGDTGVLTFTTTKGYALNLCVKDWDLIDPIGGAYVYKDSDVKQSDANGWANWTEVGGVVQIKVMWFGFWVNGTFTVTMDSDKTISIQSKIFDIVVFTLEGLQSASLQYANVTVYSGTSVEGNKIGTGITGADGKVSLANIPNSTLTFTVYDGASPAHVIGNVTRTIAAENQIEVVVPDQNYVSLTQAWNIISSYNSFLFQNSTFIALLYPGVKCLKERAITVRSKHKKREKGGRKTHEAFDA